MIKQESLLCTKLPSKLDIPLCDLHTQIQTLYNFTCRYRLDCLKAVSRELKSQSCS